MNCRREKAGLPVDDEQEYLPLSWLSQADYCLRRAALLLNERVWVENVETAKGRAEHERVHTQRVERRGDFVKLYENSVFSDEMQISGKCDCIEAVRDENGCTIPAVDFPVEYKHGKIRDESEYKIQLCAEAMCLEEMYHTTIPAGALFYITAHRRVDVELDEAALETVGLDPAAGWLHTLRPGRPSLALDLLEEFRAPLCDRLALSLFNKRQLTDKDFEYDSLAVMLNERGRKTVLTAWRDRKQEEITHPYLGEKIQVGLIAYVQAMMLARVLRGDLDCYPPFVWR